MKTTIRILASALLLISATAPGALAAAMIIFETIPASGSITGQPGTTIGWGYTITNDAAPLWVSVDAINTSAAFTNAVFDTSNFDFPVIGPGQTITEAFSPNTSGLAELTWNAGAPASAQNSGVFELSLIWYTEDPNVCDFTCTYTGVSQTFATTPYSAAATVAPEPAAFGLLLCGFLILVLGGALHPRLSWYSSNHAIWIASNLPSVDAAGSSLKSGNSVIH